MRHEKPKKVINAAHFEKVRDLCSKAFATPIVRNSIGRRTLEVAVYLQNQQGHGAVSLKKFGIDFPSMFL